MGSQVLTAAQATVFDPRIGPLTERIRSALARRGILAEVLPTEAAADAWERVDTALMALFRDTRDAEAFEVLYRRSSQAVLDWLRRLVTRDRRAVDPQEVLQDTFVNVYRYCARFRDERHTSFRVWVRTIASNALRRAQGRVPHRVEEELPTSANEPAAPTSGPDEGLCDREARRELAIAWVLFLEHYATAYAGLAQRDRAALSMVEVERLSYAEAGRRLAVGSSNMKMIMFRARQRLFARMERAMRGELAAPAPLTSAESGELRAAG